MAIDLGGFLHSVIGGVGNAAQGIEHTASNLVSGGEHAASTVVNDVSHAAQPVVHAVAAVANPVAQVVHPAVQDLNNLYSAIQPHAIGLPPLAAPAKSFINSAAKDYEYTPLFQKMAAGANPSVGKTFQGTGQGADQSDFMPATGKIVLNSDLGQTASPDANLTHELLNKAYAAKTPAQQSQFLKTVQNSISPAQRQELTQYFNSPRFNNYQLPANITKVQSNSSPMSTTVGEEIHSIMPELASRGFSNTNLPPQLQKYYSQYFNTGAANSRAQYLPDTGKAGVIAQKTGELNAAGTTPLDWLFNSAPQGQTR